MIYFPHRERERERLYMVFGGRKRILCSDLEVCNLNYKLLIVIQCCVFQMHVYSPYLYLYLAR